MDIYKNKENKAIVHAHSPHAAVSTHERVYMLALAGGSLACAEYATFGTSNCHLEYN